jgi:hypothetical protein
MLTDLPIWVVKDMNQLSFALEILIAAFERYNMLQVSVYLNVYIYIYLYESFD